MEVPGVYARFVDPIPFMSEEIQLRRKLNAELAGIGDKLSTSHFQDLFIEEISLWHQDFSSAIRTNEFLQPVLGHFANHLCHMVPNLIAQTGGDKFDTHCEWILFLIHWLKSHTTIRVSEEIEHIHVRLLDLQKSSLLSDVQRKKIEKIRKRREESDKNQTNRRKAFTSHISHLSIKAQEDLRRSDFFVEEMKSLEEIEKKDIENAQKSAEDAEHLNREVSRLEEQNNVLRRQLHSVNGLVSEVERNQNLFATPESGADPELNVHPELMETSLRRRMRADLSALNDLLNDRQTNDEMTNLIRLWHQNFIMAISLKADDQEILSEFIKLLQEMLIDPLFHAPLDENAYLGTDGHVYGEMSYEVWKHSAQEEHKNCSPMNPLSGILFTKVPHPIVRHLIQWLKNYNALLHSEDLERNYQHLQVQKRMKKIERLKNRKEQLHQEKVNKRQEADKRIQDLANELSVEILQPFKALHDEVKGHSDRISEKIEEINTQDERDRSDLTKALTEVESKIKKLKIEIHAQREKIQEVNGDISEAKKTNIELQLAIDCTRKAIEKQKKGWILGVLKIAGVIGASGLATWGITAAIGSLPSVAVLPSGNGAQLSVTALF